MLLYYKIGVVLSVLFLLLDFKYVVYRTDKIEKLFTLLLISCAFVIPAHYIYTWVENLWYRIKNYYQNYKNIKRIRKLIRTNFPKFANRPATKEETDQLIIMTKEVAYFLRSDNNLANQIDDMIIYLTKVMKAIKILKKDIKRSGYE